jgi:hypothetical protein
VPNGGDDDGKKPWWQVSGTIRAVNFISESSVAGVDGTVIVLVLDCCTSEDGDTLRSFQNQETFSSIVTLKKTLTVDARFRCYKDIHLF